MSRAEEITSEVRRLVLTCRTMEAQLQQSIPKKNHQEIVAKMQVTIDDQHAELERTKGELQNTVGLGERISTLNSLVASLSEMIDAQGKTIGGQGQTIDSQNKTIEALISKISQSTVPVLLYDQTLSKVEELEERVRFMVDRSEYVSLQKKYEDLTGQVSLMIPRTEYETLGSRLANSVPVEKYEELERTLAQSVPREQFIRSESRVHELEFQLSNTVPVEKYQSLEMTLSQCVPREQLSASQARVQELEVRLANTVPIEKYAEAEQTLSLSVPRERLLTSETRIQELETQLSDSVPRRVYEELTTRIAALTREAASAMSIEVSPATTLAQSPNEVAQVPTEEHFEVVGAEVTPAETVPATMQITTPEQPTEQKPEISEIQTQLAEIKGAAETGETTYTPAVQKVVEGSMGFIFSNTSFCARSGLEFIDDLERVPIQTVESHSRNGDFERWFKEALQDETSADSLKSIRESNCAGEELRTKIIAVVAPRYKS